MPAVMTAASRGSGSRTGSVIVSGVPYQPPSAASASCGTAMGGLVAGEDIGEDGQGGLGGASAFGKGPQVLAGEEGGHHRHSKLVSGPGLEHGPVCRSTTGLSDGIR